MDDLSDLMFPPSNDGPLKPSKSAFDYLSSGGRYTPSPTPPARPQSALSNASPKADVKVATSGDAFSSIFGATAGSTSKVDMSKLSMAERLAAQKPGNLGVMNGSSSGRASPALAAPLNPHNISRSSSPAPILRPSSTSATPTPVMARTSSDPWDFDMLPSSLSNEVTPAIKQETTLPISRHSKQDSWGFSFDDGEPTRGARATSRTNPSVTVHSPLPLFEEDPSSGNDSRDSPANNGLSLPPDEAVLGTLGQPIDEVAVRRQAAAFLEIQSSNSAKPARSSTSANLNASPPPHVLGQVVEMGFGIAEAKSSLMKTRNAGGEWNVESAVNRLVGGQPDDERPSTSMRDSSRHQSPPHVSSRPRPSGARPPQRQRTLTEPPTVELTPSVSPMGQDQTAVLLAQASAYGSSAIGMASAFWKQGKASLAKALEERDESNAKAGTSPDSRPRWMRDGQLSTQENASSPQDWGASSSQLGFKDDSDNENDHVARPPPPSRSAKQRYQESNQAQHPKLLDLLGVSGVLTQDNVPKPAQSTSYVSSARRRGPDRSSRAKAPEAGPSRTPSAPVQPLREPRQLPRPSPAQIASTTAHKQKGNEAFKRGQFGEAETAYGRGLDALPEGCWERIALWNNRAMARLKNGDGKAAMEDATRAVCLICGIPDTGDNIHSQGSAGWKLDFSGLDIDTPAARIDLRDQLGKALSRRAKAAEAREKWAEAGKDWETIRGAGEAINKAAGGAKVVGDGALRCNRLAQGAQTTNASSAPKLSTRPTPARKQPSAAPSHKASAAVHALRTANDAAEAEAAERFSLKDSVDAKILAWKGGKEANLRALIASLENVLWEGLAWKKVGMGELLTDAQVKVKYVRAIAKVHPDKIPKDATVEEQMIAKSVFAALNEAWLAVQG